MEVMLMPLFCDQRSNALSTNCSACDSSTGSVFVRICSQRARRLASRLIRRVPSSMSCRILAMRLARVVQKLPSGERISLSAAKSPIATPATIARSCCRFLICTDASFRPVKIKRELQRGHAPADTVYFHIANAGLAQGFSNFEQRLIVLCRASVSDGVEVANFDGLRGN